MSEALAQQLCIALIGNPNCGKTALFNALTGSRQKVANYPGVTVERKEGIFETPGGRRIHVLDLPGTYSLRARSPDEAITRDTVLGQLVTEAAPDLVVCVADATNLRLTLRLVLELKKVGRPIVLALNMFDIAERRGIGIDMDALSRDLGIPVVSTVAVRRNGIAALLRQIDRLAPESGSNGPGGWREPSAEQVRSAHGDAQRILDACVTVPGHPDIWTRRLDRVVLHPVAGILILLAVLFRSFRRCSSGRPRRWN